MALPASLPQLTRRPALSAYHVLAPDATGRGHWAFQTTAGPPVPVTGLSPALVAGQLPSYELDFSAPLPQAPGRRLGGPGWLLALSLAMWAGLALVVYCFCAARP